MQLKITHFILIKLIILLFTSCGSQMSYNSKLVVGLNENIDSDLVMDECAIDEDILLQSESGNSYNFMRLRSYLGSLNVIVKNNPRKYCTDNQRVLIDNIIQSAKKSSDIVTNQSFNDSFYGWVVTKANKKNRSTINKEIPLFESYSFFYITQFLYILKENDWIEKSKENKDWWEGVLTFVVEHEWKKWYERGYKFKGAPYRYFLRSRTHMGSHWAGIAMYLAKLTSDSEVKEQCVKLKNDYDLLLRRNFKTDSKHTSAYIWNATYDNVTETEAIETHPSIIQDVSHGNHVVSYIVAAYEMGDPNWNDKDIKMLCNTFKYIVYDRKTNTFADNLDGSVHLERPERGHFVADGWIKLSRYDKEVAAIFKQSLENELIKKYNRESKLRTSLMIFTD